MKDEAKGRGEPELSGVCEVCMSAMPPGGTIVPWRPKWFSMPESVLAIRIAPCDFLDSELLHLD